MPTIGTRIFTMLRGRLVGKDDYGNRYYRAGKTRKGSLRKERRWVIYKGGDEASKVPPEWHAWLHHMVSDPPAADRVTYAWQKPHQPNLTGTAQAYRPPGHTLKGGHRAPATGDYEPWTPA